MQYRKNSKNGDELSILGYGCMRYTKKGGKFDVPKAEAEMLYALEQGVNYFDTAYTYRGCEELLGNFLAKGHREKVFIATKLPHYTVKTLEDAKKIFKEELRRLQTDYIDYYLIHMLTDVGSWERLKSLGVVTWLEELKAQKVIRNLGFSYHGGTQSFCDIVQAYPWDFTQIQFNYLDEHSQAGRRGLEFAAAKGLPIVIMEPLRGGRLAADLPKEAQKVFATVAPEFSAAQWGLRWVWNCPEVTVVLSGMNDLTQVEENVAAAATAKANALTAEELGLFTKVKEVLEAGENIPCTGCGYCLPCPYGVDIPNCFRCYNISYSDGKKRGTQEYIMATGLRLNPSNAGLCRRCGKCKSHCPQKIDVPIEIQKVKKRFEGLSYNWGLRIAKLFVKF